MGKSTRSKWKKMHKRLRAEDEAPLVAARLEKLNSKLDLVVHGGLSKVPMQDPETRFHFAAPSADTRKQGERLQLQPLTTNPRGKSDPTAPHPQTFTFDTVPLAAPVAGCAISVADVERMQAASAATFQQAFQAAMKKANAKAASGGDDDEPVEITIGCNDDEYLNQAIPQAASSKKKGIVVKKVSSSAPPAAPVSKKGAKKDVAEAPAKVKIASMALRKNETAGSAKIKTGAPKTRIVSGTSTKPKK
jgi:hypothetical protein